VVIRVESVTFGYRRAAPILRDVSFELAAGEFLAIGGPNGSGKSTLVSLLDGLRSPDRGRVLLDGRPVGAYSRREVARRIAYVAQSADVHFPFTVLEYVLQGRFAHGRVFGFESDEDVSAARRALEMTATTGFESRRIDELSGGERQRVMLARALAQEPRALLLDEPTANLDISHQLRMLDLVRNLVHGCGLAAAVVTHDLNLAAEFADRILMLKAGEVRGLGSPRDVLTPELVADVFDARVLVDASPASGAPRVTLVAPIPSTLSTETDRHQ
jgi:iron complex transport system ATP-binding protein